MSVAAVAFSFFFVQNCATDRYAEIKKFLSCFVFLRKKFAIAMASALVATPFIAVSVAASFFDNAAFAFCVAAKVFMEASVRCVGLSGVYETCAGYKCQRYCHECYQLKNFFHIRSPPPY